MFIDLKGIRRSKLNKNGKRSVKSAKMCGKLSLWLLASEVCTILNALYEVEVARKRVELRNMQELDCARRGRQLMT